MNIDIVGKFYLGNGGVGDALLFLSTFYDYVDEANIIFLANDTKIIKEFFDCFSKLQKKLIIHNDFYWLNELYHHPNCIGTGILPKNLDYSKWYKVDIFKEYSVKEFPDFLNLFEPAIIDPNKKQIFVQHQGSSVEGEQKKRILLRPALLETQKIIDSGWQYVGSEDTIYNHRSLKETIQLIRGSDLVVSVDSFAKTVSAMSKIKTIVYDNVYEPEYLAKFQDMTDAGHYVFIYPFSYIELRKQ